MKIWKLALAVLLAAGTVAAYVWFPNPVEQASRHEAPAPPAQDPPTNAAPGGEST